MSHPDAATYAETILPIIRQDLQERRFTAAQITSFSDLHDYVDANEYLLQAGVPWGADLATDSDPDGSRIWNAVADLLDTQIRSGALRA